MVKRDRERAFMVPSDHALEDITNTIPDNDAGLRALLRKVARDYQVPQNQLVLTWYGVMSDEFASDPYGDELTAEVNYDGQAQSLQGGSLDENGRIRWHCYAD